MTNWQTVPDAELWTWYVPGTTKGRKAEKDSLSYEEWFALDAELEKRFADLPHKRTYDLALAEKTKQEAQDERKKAEQLAAADARLEAKLEAKRVSNLTGSFSWKKLVSRKAGQVMLSFYLQFKHQGKMVCAFPPEALRTHWKALAKLLKSKANVGSGSGQLWAFMISEDCKLPSTPQEKHTLLLLFEKALKEVYARLAEKLNTRRANSIVDQLVRIEQVFNSLDYSRAQHREAIRYFRDKEEYQNPKKLAEEVTGVAPAHSAARELRRWGQEYNEADIEDITSETWLAQHDEEILREELEKEGLEWNADNLRRVHDLIDQRARENSKPSCLGARRAANRWRDEVRKRNEVSLGSAIHSKDEGELLLQEVLQPTAAITAATANKKDDAIFPKRPGGIVLNDRLVSSQSEEEERYPTIFADKRGMLRQVAAVLKPDQFEWLLRYYAKPEADSENKAKAKSSAERSKASRIIKKARAALKTVTALPI